MAFKKIRTSKVAIETPEALLHDLRAKTIKGPISHQADMWRNYLDKALEESDVALQLPTGSGKTLVGLILAEWRRQKYNEKVVYLCPTNQLVHQVVEQAENKYGLSVAKFVGKIKDYPLAVKSDYEGADKIAVTSYSALFNTNSFFNDADIIIFDDAHASENYISSLWSLEISRHDDESKALFVAFANLIKNHIPQIDYDRMTNNDSIEDWVDKLPITSFLELKENIEQLLDTHCMSTSMQYPWRMIKDHLIACQCYISSNKILIRPMIPPTMTHAPFASAKQRIYMSATLGNGGDLERLTGVAKIFRLPIPTGWDKQGIGRRFFLFPERSLAKDADIHAFLKSAMEMSGRSVVLTKDFPSAEEFEKFVNEEIKYGVFNATDIEQSKKDFLEEEKAVAIIANRYDGIDFAEDEARTLIISDLSTSTNLQEKFFVSRMAANELLNERILTRIVQAMGRCTRSPTDYSAVIVLGEKLVSYLLPEKKRKLLHPELQAELEFGIEQSKDATLEDFIDNLQAFLDQTPDWFEADKEIITLRDELTKIEPKYITNLQNSVSSEISYQYKMLQTDYEGAIDEARNVLKELTDPTLKGYRALWNYLGGSASLLAGNSDLAIDFFKNAMKAAPSLKWMVTLAKSSGVESFEHIEDNDLNNVIENFEKQLKNYGLTSNRKYDKEEKFILDGILTGDAKEFEEAQKRLGILIGFEAGNVESDASPDPWWMLSEKLCVVFEDHSEGTKEFFDATKARQATTHDNWIRENLPVDTDIEIIKVLITPLKKAHSGALPHLKDVYLWTLDDFRDWTKHILGVLRSARNSYNGEGDLFWRTTIKDIYIANHLSPNLLVENIKSITAYDFFTNK
jgi:tetratricopeptide (TPR) repeat protein